MNKFDTEQIKINLQKKENRSPPIKTQFKHFN